MVRLNLRLDDVRNCEEKMKVVKEYEKIIKCKKKGILNLACNQRFLFKKFKGPDNFKETLKEIEISKTCKSLRKVSKKSLF